MSQSTQETTKFSWIPGFFKYDILRKAIALFFAILFYFIVISRLGVEEQISNIPVDIDLPTTLVYVGEQTPKVSIIIKGSKGILKETSRSSFKIRASVKLSDYISGEFYTLRLNTTNISAPLGVKIVRIEPRDLLLNLDRKVSKKVKVTPTFANKDALPQGYAVDHVSFQPSEVLVAGPESILKKILSVKSAPIPLSSSLIDSFDYKTEIVDEPSISISPKKVNAQVKIIRQITEPVFMRVRRFMPRFLFRSGFVLSPIFVLLVIILLDTVLTSLLFDAGRSFLSNGIHN